MPHYLRVVIEPCRAAIAPSRRHVGSNIGTLRMIVKLEREFGVFNCRFAFETIAPAPDLFLALFEDIVHFFVAVVLVVMK